MTTTDYALITFDVSLILFVLIALTCASISRYAAELSAETEGRE